jgi:hypothetical protein
VVDEDLDGLRYSKDKVEFVSFALQQLYQKPWYEVHALLFLDWLEGRKALRRPVLARETNTDFAGALGRLVEQYYWRLRFEPAAITGAGARLGASTGGKVRAANRRRERLAWQREASDTWARRPKLSKMVVARAIRKYLRLKHSAKHIARYIRRS